MKRFLLFLLLLASGPRHGLAQQAPLAPEYEAPVTGFATAINTVF